MSGRSCSSGGGGNGAFSRIRRRSATKYRNSPAMGWWQNNRGAPVMGEMVQNIYNVSDRLVKTRRQLLGLDYDTGLEHLTLLRAVIVLEEFCKELAAITFVKQPLDQN